MAASQERTALDGLEKKMVTLMSTGATKSRWAEWLQAPLELALAAGDKRLALTLLKAGDDGSAGLVGLNGRSLLGAAVEGGNHELVNAVLEAGGSEEVDTGSGPDNMTALHLAAIGGHTKTARALMLAGAQVGALDRRRRTVLHYAVEGGHLPLVKNVMAGGVDLNVGDDDGDTALHIASAQGDEAIVTALIREGACVIATNRRRRPPLHAAVEGDHVAVAGALLKAGADPDALYDDGRSPLFVARSSLAMTRALLKSGARVTIKDKSYGFTALHLVARYGEGDVVHALVDAGANVSARSCSRGSRHNSHRYITPLHNAARGCNLGTMSALLRHGADVNAIDMHGETSLHWVCKSKDNTYSADAADLLLRWGADETLTDYSKDTPLQSIARGEQWTTEESESKNITRLQEQLANAPADRTWRRRGVLLMYRAFPDKMQTKRGKCKAGKAKARRDHGRGCGGGGGSGGAGGERGSCDVLTRVVKLDDDEIFRAIVCFL